MRITEIESIVLQHDIEEAVGFAQAIGVELNQDFVQKYRVA